jgi:hypothetical protein
MLHVHQEANKVVPDLVKYYSPEETETIYFILLMVTRFHLEFCSNCFEIAVDNIKGYLTNYF